MSDAETFARILLTGANGQIGSALTRQLLPAFPKATLLATTRECVDLARPETLAQTVRGFSPDLVINAAAYTAVDRAEQEPALAQQINAVAPGVLAEESRRCGAVFIHYSTDYVFDGAKRAPYSEDDAVHPLNEYGRSKRAGEEAILQTGAAALILRTSWVYGLTGHNFLRTMRRLANERDELRIVDDQTGVPNDSEALAAATVRLAAQGKERLREQAGLYHLSAAGETSWFGFAQAIFAALPAGSKRPRLIPVTTADYPLPAARPAYGVLSSARLRQTFGIELPDWLAMLQACLARETT